MSTAQKVAVSLLISVILFAAFTVAAFAGLFTLIETRFYQPSIIKSITQQLNTTSNTLSEYNNAQLIRFKQFVEDETVQKAVNPIQTTEDINRRTDLAGTLMAETPGLLGIRVIDAGGKRIHFSTFSTDILRRENTAVAYQNYGTQSTDIPFEQVVTADTIAARAIFNPQYNQLIYSYPFYDSYTAYRGTILFYVSANELSRYLISKNIIRVNDPLLIIGNEKVHGIVLGLPQVGQHILIDEILNRWQSGLSGTERIATSEDSTWVLFSTQTPQLGFTGQLYAESILAFPSGVKVLLLVSLFITVYLIIFLIFNLKQDDMIVIRSHIRRFQLAVIAEYLEKGEEINWDTVAKEIIYRKHDLTSEIKKTLGKRAKRHPQEVQSLLDKSWEEIVNAIGKKTQQNTLPPTNAEEIKTMLEQVLKSGVIPAVSAVPPPAHTAVKQLKESTDIIEEIEEFDDFDDAEELGEVEEIEEVEDFDDAEVLTEDISNLEDVSSHFEIDLPPKKPIEEIREELKFGVEEHPLIQEDIDQLPLITMNIEPLRFDELDNFDNDSDYDAIREAIICIQKEEVAPESKKKGGFLSRAKAVAEQNDTLEKTDVIILENDGTYRIAENRNFTPVEKNNEFKELVDSVLK